MGVVYRAQDTSLRRTVALKVVRPELASDAYVRGRFYCEAIAASRVAHRNVVPIIEYGELETRAYLSMAYISGTTLGHRLRSGPLPLPRARALIDQVLSAVCAIHASGVVHGDLKSENILVSEPDEHAMLIDFGLARVRDYPPPRGSATLVSGTPEYLAPERIHGGEPTIASDLYAVGVMLYELVSGATPFEGGSSARILTRHLDEPVPPLRAIDPRLPPELDALIAHALEKDPADRIATASEFRRALAAIPIAERDWTHARPWDRCELPTRPCTVAGVDIDTLREAVGLAIRGGQREEIVLAYLDLAHALVAVRQVRTAVLELEQAVDVVTAGGGIAQVDVSLQIWRLYVMLAGLHGQLGHAALAEQHARTAIEQAERSGSYAGHLRGWALLELMRTMLTRRDDLRR